MDFLTIDVGTSSIKAAVVSERGKIISEAKEPHMLRSEKPGYAAVDLRQLKGNTLRVLSRLSAHAKEVRAIMVTSLGETAAILDGDGELIFDEGITYLDERNNIEWDILKDAVNADALYAMTGKQIPQVATVNQCKWWEKEEPCRYGKARRILSVDSYIAYCLCGESAFDISVASNTLLYDVFEHRWSERLKKAFAFDSDVFPPVIPAGTCIGHIRPEICRATGLPEGIEVLSGCHDQISATIGAGAVALGSAMLNEGSTEALNVVQSRENAIPLLAVKMPIEPFIDKDTYVIMSSQYSHGNCLKWFAGLFQEGKDGEDAFAALNGACPASTSEIVFIPRVARTWYSGEKDHTAGTLLGLHVDSTKGQIYRAVLEGLSCETLRMIKEVEAGGVRISNLIATGGASASRPYMQIKSDILDRQIDVLSNNEAGIRGLAMICAVRKGVFRDLSEAAECFCSMSERYRPAADSSCVISRYEDSLNALKGYYAQYHQDLEV